MKAGQWPCKSAERRQACLHRGEPNEGRQQSLVLGFTVQQPTAKSLFAKAAGRQAVQRNYRGASSHRTCPVMCSDALSFHRPCPAQDFLEALIPRVSCCCCC